MFVKMRITNLQKCLNPNTEKEDTYIDKQIAGDTGDIIGAPQVSI